MQETNNENHLMTVEELAELLACSKVSIYKLTRKGQTSIPHLRTPGGIRFEKEAVIEFFRHHESTNKI